ncbi:MAG: hypothetical protein K1X95_09365 [Acidimicrobiia bacterium]|nr:hypothetical protein [Acidimicrobiia bacterium]
MICPRCGTDAEQEYYGPCAACREQLRAGAAAAARARGDANREEVAPDEDRALQGQERAIGS